MSALAAEGLQGFSPDAWVGEMSGALPADARLALGQIESTTYLRNQLLRDSDWASMDHSVEVIALGNEYPAIAAWLQPLLAAAEANPGMARARLDYEPTSPRVIVEIDREKAAALGVSAQAVGRARGR